MMLALLMMMAKGQESSPTAEAHVRRRRWTAAGWACCLEGGGWVDDSMHPVC